MTTPIYDFLRGFKNSGISRFHMPAHKGRRVLGVEKLDITEISGADVLSHADGIIAESEKNATRLFNTAHTYYSTEGSTLAIKTMLALATREEGEGALVLAARNVHKSFIYAAGELGFEVDWIYPKIDIHPCKCTISADDVRDAISACGRKPTAVYITTPDYLGGMLDVSAIAALCRSADIPLLVDNAHGAYLAFCEPFLHPMALGASMCADSAHKTLPVLTGGAYLHIARGYEKYTDGARQTMAVFASTSPSYLTLASLDLCNLYLEEKSVQEFSICKEKVAKIKARLCQLGQELYCDEPMKIVIDAYRFGYTGADLSAFLRSVRIECEYADSRYVVLMPSPKNSHRDFNRLSRAIEAVANKKREQIPTTHVLPLPRPSRAYPIRVALFKPQQSVAVEGAIGRICATPTVSCPPAVPIMVSGEIIDECAVRLFLEHGITEISVVKE